MTGKRAGVPSPPVLTGGERRARVPCPAGGGRPGEAGEQERADEARDQKGSQMGIRGDPSDGPRFLEVG